MKNKQFIAGFASCFVLGLACVSYASVQVQATPEVKTFDHSQCQYPNRTTNPVNGCDNSDPCDAANTKAGSGDCNPPAPVAEPTPEVLEPVAPAPVEGAVHANCKA